MEKGNPKLVHIKSKLLEVAISMLQKKKKKDTRPHLLCENIFYFHFPTFVLILIVIKEQRDS